MRRRHMVLLLEPQVLESAYVGLSAGVAAEWPHERAATDAALARCATPRRRRARPARRACLSMWPPDGLRLILAGRAYLCSVIPQLGAVDAAGARLPLRACPRAASHRPERRGDRPCCALATAPRRRGCLGRDRLSGPPPWLSRASALRFCQRRQGHAASPVPA